MISKTGAAAHLRFSALEIFAQCLAQPVLTGSCTFLGGFARRIGHGLLWSIEWRAQMRRIGSCEPYITTFSASDEMIDFAVMIRPIKALQVVARPGGTGAARSWRSSRRPQPQRADHSLL